MEAQINFKEIVAHGGSQTKSFEELCTQLARRTIKASDKFERYHGDAGDGGVECVSISDDGSITGWQAKFVTSVGNLISQADTSLATAIKVHPSLTKYIICFPFDLTGQTARKTSTGKPTKSGTSKLTKWIADTITRHKLNGAALETIEIWAANNLNALLLEHDVSGGMRSYFFSSTVLSKDWFTKNVNSSARNAEPRYSPQLTVKTDIWHSFDAFGQTDGWKKTIHDKLIKVSTVVKEFKSNINKPGYDPTFPGLPSKYNAIATQVVETLYSAFGLLVENFTKKNLELAKENLIYAIGLLEKLEVALSEDLTLKYPGENWDTKPWRTFMAEYNISFPAANIDGTRELSSVVTTFLDFVHSSNFHLATEKIMVLSGIGGSGKTHSICDISLIRLADGLLSCVIFGDKFSGNPDEWTRFGEAIGMGAVSTDQLLDALNSAGEQSGKPLIIFLDAINETIPRTYWVNKIAGFADEIAKRDYLKLCISCRSSYLKTCLPSRHRYALIEHKGFTGIEREACNTFFAFYNLNTPIIPVLQPEMSNPLYLKLLCSTLHDRGEKDLPMGWLGILPVIKAFLNEKEIQLCHQNGLSSNASMVVRSLTTIINEIVSGAKSALSWSDAITAISELGFSIETHKLLDWLVASDLLIEDGSLDNDEQLAPLSYVRPAFERLGDFILAAELANQAVKFRSVLDHPKMIEIFKDEANVDLNASVIAALSIIFPESHEIELPSLFKNSELYDQVAAIATKALIWRSPESLTKNTREFVVHSMRIDGESGLDALFAICTNKSVMDARWLNDIFSLTDLPRRDAFLSHYFKTSYIQNGIVKKLIDAHKDLDLSLIDTNIAHRWLLSLLWMTASPDRRIKDEATRAAIAILKHNTFLSEDLFTEGIAIDDEEVIERLLLIIYAAQILNPDIKTLRKLSTGLLLRYEENPQMFENALIRDHIRCIGELAAKLNCLPEGVNPLTATKKAFEKSKVFNDLEGESVNSINVETGAIRLMMKSTLHDDFNHYSIQCLSPWMSSFDRLKIGNWIVDDVIRRKGLNNDLHGYYDSTVVRETGGGRSKPSYAERLGKKYQWNSLYRLAAILNDNLERKSRNSDPEFVQPPLILQEERKIDPTLTQPNLSSTGKWENWWIAPRIDLRATEEIPPLKWLDFQSDIPSFQNILSEIQFENQNWIPMSSSLYASSKDMSNSYSPYRWLNLWVDAFLVENKNLSQIVAALNGKNLSGDTLPNEGSFSNCYLGEYPWATACNTHPDSYFGVETNLGETNLKMQNACNQIVCEWEYDATMLEKNLYLVVPSKKLFELNDLWWNGVDGYKRKDGITVFKDPRILTGGNRGLIADVDDLKVRLSALNCSIIWTLRGEKHLADHGLTKERKYISQIAWMDEKGMLNFGRRMFFNNFDSKKGTPERKSTSSSK